MTEDKIFRWIHVSDLHIGHNNYIENAMREELPVLLDNICKEKKIHGLFITGDLIYAPKYKEQINELKKAVKDNVKSQILALQKAVNVRNGFTYIAIGNHDVVRTRDKNNSILALNKEYRSKAGIIDETKKGFIDGAENRFGDLYYTVLKRKFHKGHYLDTRRNNIEILHIDTTISAEAFRDEENKNKIYQDGQLIIGTELFVETVKRHRKGCPVIAIGHHPLTALQEDESALIIHELQKIGVQLYLCGHTHVASIRKLGTEQSPIWQICCGTNMERLENSDPTDMTFYLGEYDLEKRQGSIIAYQYYYRQGGNGNWELSRTAPFEQKELEKEMDERIFYFPSNKSPLYTMLKKYSRSITKVSELPGVVVTSRYEPNKKRKLSENNQNSEYSIYEGDTGYGKTIMLKQMVKKDLEGLKAEQDIVRKMLEETIKVPFFINFESDKLQYISDGNCGIPILLANSIHMQIRDNEVMKRFSEWCEHIARKGSMILYIDGLDKMTDTERKLFTDDLLIYLKKYPKVKTAITSKFYVFDEPEIRNKFSAFTFYQMCSFTDPEIQRYCLEWYKDKLGSDKSEKKAKKIAEQILRDDSLKEISRVPLLLNTLLQVNHSTDSLPNNRIRLYNEFVYTLLKNEHNPQSVIQLLSAIAFQMGQKPAYSLHTVNLKVIIDSVYEECDWLQWESMKDEKFDSCAFIARMDKDSKLLKKVGNNVVFYHNSFQDYFASIALVKGYYPGLKKSLPGNEVPLQNLNIPMLNEVYKLFDSISKSDMLIMTILQLDAYETAIVVQKLIEKIADVDSWRETGIVVQSHLRNVLLRVILDGALISKKQRTEVFETVQKHNIFDLQADLLEKIWNSRFGDEFKKTCSPYIDAMFELLKKYSNPIRHLVNRIEKLEKEDDAPELEKELYVLDGVIWSTGRKYIDIFKEYTENGQLDEIIILLKKIILDGTADGLCRRRACGVLQRLLATDEIDDVEMRVIGALFDVFESEVHAKYSQKTMEDDKYAGIRIFHTLPLTKTNLQYLNTLSQSAERKSYYLGLYKDAQNTLDRIGAFQAALLCKSLTEEEVDRFLQDDEYLGKSEMVDFKQLNERVKLLKEEQFF